MNKLSVLLHKESKMYIRKDKGTLTYVSDFRMASFFDAEEHTILNILKETTHCIEPDDYEIIPLSYLEDLKGWTPAQTCPTYISRSKPEDRLILILEDTAIKTFKFPLRRIGTYDNHTNTYRTLKNKEIKALAWMEYPEIPTLSELTMQ